MDCLYVSNNVITSSLLLVCVYLVVGQEGGNISHQDNGIIQVSLNHSENKWLNLSSVNKLTADKINPKEKSKENSNAIVFHGNNRKSNVSLSSFVKNYTKNSVVSSIAASGSDLSNMITRLIMSQRRIKRDTHNARCLPARMCHGVDVQYASICPWSYNSHYDGTREPSTIYEAVCDCTTYYAPYPDANIQCEPIMVNVTVRRFTSQGNWITGYQMVSKGCTPVLSCPII